MRRLHQNIGMLFVTILSILLIYSDFMSILESTGDPLRILLITIVIFFYLGIIATFIAINVGGEKF